LFKQALDQRAPELLVGGDDNVVIARMDPTGSAILYLLSTPASEYMSQGMRIMRIPVNGGVPQLILTDSAISNFQCARRGSTVCVLSTYAPDHLSLYTFDSVSGQKKLLKTIYDSEWSLFNWSLAPDGTMLALSKKQPDHARSEISLLGLDGKEGKVSLAGWFAIDYIDWAADGKSVWVNASTSDGTPTLLKVARNGKITPVLEESEMALGWAIPSPDGRRIAIWKGEQGSNVWLLEGF
jgi:Tol biopolymer transport system component